MIARFFAHLTIVLSTIAMTLLVIDRFNGAMMFIDNDMTKYLLLALMPLSFANAVLTLRHPRRKGRKKTRP